MGFLKLHILVTLCIIYAQGQDSSNNKTSFLEHLPEDCGRTRYDNRLGRIINGDEAKLGQFPWIVRLGLFKRGPRIYFFCGGSLITRYYVLSAAHCDEKAALVRVGENYVQTEIDCNQFNECAPPFQDIEVGRYIFADYCVSSGRNDIFFIELAKPAEFNDFVQPACLPMDPVLYDDLLGSSVLVAGWGAMDSTNRTLPGNLMYISNAVVERKECTNITGHRLFEGQLCIGITGRGNGSCFGDSGGPVTMNMQVNGTTRGYLLGIVSYGHVICENGPAVYTNVVHYIDWILSNIVKN